jgi:hypothetical protein
LTNDEGEVREWTAEDFANAVHFSALPAELQALLPEPKHVSPDADPASTEQPAA